MFSFDETYSREDFIEFLDGFLPDFESDIRKASFENLKAVKSVTHLGKSKKLDLQVFELTHKVSPGARVTLATDGFRIMKQSAGFQALAVFRSDEDDDWRLSLMTANPKITEKGKATVEFSNPRRYSFFLGPNAKINTPTKFLKTQGKIFDEDDLRNRFSIEVVNKDFYKEISYAFTKLVSGLLKLPSTEDKSQASLEFAVRLIGRIIFCWFLKEKKSEAELSLMPKDLLSLDAVKENDDYYHKILEPIFFEVLNKQAKSRIDDLAKEPFSFVPYLNGGLFSPQEDDYYKRANGDFQSQFHNSLVIPDNWFKEFFEILETYNFTIDENTSYDEELSIDPEMLGRIFENLLAEINPETGESARKNTGSYYTPRTIVNYMVDESLLLYLKEQTGIQEEKLRAIISYDLNDDLENPLTLEEKEKIIDALEKVKILDPACGSGAFPIGALQKIVFILQHTDPDGKLWFKKQINNIPPEIKQLFEREFNNKNFDYIRKLGIIRENIYGIDIQPIASEISRLRCFLTLIVDQKIQDDLENRGIEALPNLDFKFVTANSLIDLPKSKKLKDNSSEQIAMFDDNKKIEELKQIRNEYFTSSGIEREQLKSQFSKIQKDLIFQLIQDHGLMSLFKAELTHKLTEWDPFSHKASSWFDPEWMFGIKEGFDIVITNPPYITIRNQSPEVRHYIKDNFKYSGGADLYVAFIEKTFLLITNNGVAVFICPNKFFGADYGKKIRKELRTGVTKIYSIWDLKDEKVFDALISTVVILFKNNLKKDKVILKKDAGFTELDVFDDRLKIQIEQSIEDKGFINKLIKFNILSSFSKIRTGVMGFEYWKMEPIIHEGGSGLPLLTNGNIGQFFENWGENEITLYKKRFVNPRIDLNPKYLNTNTINLFKQTDKIVVRGVAKRLTACLDTRGSGVLVAVHTVTPTDKKNVYYLLGLINSKLLNWFHLHTYYSVRIPQGSLKYPVDCISTLPIPDPEKNKHLFGKISNAVKEIYEHPENSDVLKQQINEMVYELYDLTPKERNVIESKN